MGKSNKGADGKDGKVPVQSRQFSCSELKEGHQVLLAVKSENLSEEALQKQIQDLFLVGKMDIMNLEIWPNLTLYSAGDWNVLVQLLAVPKIP